MVQQPICETIQLITMGNSVVVEGEYEWKPLACLKCNIFGHSCRTSAPASALDRIVDGAKEAEPVQGVNFEDVAVLAKGKGVVISPSSDGDDLSPLKRQFMAADEDHASRLVENRCTHIGESSSPKGALQEPGEPTSSQPANGYTVAESESASADTGWKQVKRRNKKKKMKIAAREAAAAAAASLGLSPPSNEGQVLKFKDYEPEVPPQIPKPTLEKKDPPKAIAPTTAVQLALSESSDEISNSSVHEDFLSDDDPQSVQRPLPKGPLPARVGNLQDQLLRLRSHPPPSVASKRPSAGKKTTRKR